MRKDESENQTKVKKTYSTFSFFTNSVQVALEFLIIPDVVFEKTDAYDIKD